jgi:hypothetical protein
MIFYWLAMRNLIAGTILAADYQICVRVYFKWYASSALYFRSVGLPPLMLMLPWNSL